MPKLFVTIEGGMVSCVCSHQPARFQGVEVVVVDYDTDDAKENELTLIRQKDGSVEPAHVHIHGVVGADISIESDIHEATDPAQRRRRTAPRPPSVARTPGASFPS
jgi:hypothetical protein